MIDFRAASRARRGGFPTASFGLVTELVDTEAATQPRRRDGVIHIGEVATVCLVEQVPAVGDVIGGAVPGIVEKVSISRRGRLMIYARPLPAPLP